VLNAARSALAKGKLRPGEINLILLEDGKIRGLNRKYIKKDRNTDVITFRYSEAPLDGDIFLSKGVRNGRRRRPATGGETNWLTLPYTGYCTF